MKTERFFLTADYIHEGIDKCEWFEIVSPDEKAAVFSILHYLEAQGKDVQCIVTVLGVNSMDELKEFVDHGPKHGTVCVTHIFDREE